MRILHLLLSMGGALEIYDFVIYLFFAKPIAQELMSSAKFYSPLFLVLWIFAFGYLFRPIGALLFGTLGDRYGRAVSVKLPIFILAGASILLAMIPSYARIGILAPMMLLMIRILQGIALGAEMPSAIVYLRELDPSRCLFKLSMLFFWGGIGLITSFLVVWFLQLTIHVDYAWRVAFAIGGVAALTCFLFRNRFRETPAYLKLVEEKKQEHRPLSTLLKGALKETIHGFFLVSPTAALIGVNLVILPLYVEAVSMLSLSRALIVGISVGIFFTILIPLIGRVSSYTNPQSPYLLFVFLMILFMPGLYKLICCDLNGTRMLGLIGVAIISGGVIASMPMLLSSLFPISIRLTGTSLSYSLSFAIWAGFVPLLFHHYAQVVLFPGYYLSFSGVITLIGYYLSNPN